MNPNQDGLTDLARIRVLTRELIALLDGVTKALPIHRARTLLAARQLTSVVTALPNPEMPNLDFGSVFEQFDDNVGSNPAPRITE